MYLFFLCIVLFQLCLIDQSNEYEYEEKYFKQKIDHFGYSNENYFPQRYLISQKYWDSNNGPIFFYTGNEGDITMFANNTGFMWEQAPYFKAMLIFAEHRYYGLSLPFGNDSYSDPKKLGYLTSEQALADYVMLIHYLKNTLHTAIKSPVIAFGGSYGGMLAAWMRMKYPHIVKGAIASSAPILQFFGLTSCEKFSEVVTQDFNYYGSSCTESIRKSWKIIHDIGNTTTGAKWLSENFRLCKPMLPCDIPLLINWLQDTWNYMAMLNYPYETNFLLPIPAYPIKEACKVLNNTNHSDEKLLSSIFKAASVFQNYTGFAKCFNLSVSGGSSLGGRMWQYQSCTEMVMPMCSNGKTDMFEYQSWDFDAYTRDCQKEWKVTPELEKILMIYGGKNISAASNIFFSNGDWDPWSAGGVLNSISDTLIASVMTMSAHHLDLRASNPADPYSVIKTRAEEILWIKKWVMQS